jgi:hypothetical protein
MKDFSNTATTHGVNSSSKVLDENMMIGELQRELVDTKEKLKAITAKFTAVRKERDQLKTETKDLQ